MKVAYEDVLKMRQQDLQKSDVKTAELESKSRSLAEVMCREAHGTCVTHGGGSSKLAHA
jgi:hypothetical protein